MNSNSANSDPVLYVLVIGFHHKKGCQVEYSYPSLVPGSPNECPPGWKYLPTLALPDGSHNYEEDTVYFHLPSLTKPRHTIYGISCFRQIPVGKLKNRTSDITRDTVQKSVCVLSKIPLFGQIQVKMSLITHAYFEEGDFSKISILEDTYHHLNAVLIQNNFHQQMFVGLSARDFILQWKHKAVLLFKLLLLEKRTVFYKSPVYPLCSNILTLVSLFPDMIEKGLHQSACIRLSRPMSPMPEFSDEELSPGSSSETEFKNNIPNIAISKTEVEHRPSDVLELNSINNVFNEELTLTDDVNTVDQKFKISAEVGVELTESNDLQPDELVGSNSTEDPCDGNQSDILKRDNSADTLTDLHKTMSYLGQLKTATCGFPLPIFTQGCLCLPYLSLPYLDLLSDANVRGYLVGATNILFKQKRQLYDILVDVDTNRIECQDMELRKSLHLTTEDLRFADYVVKHVSEERHDVFLDGVGWEGGDEWIRTQFRIYLMCMMRTSLLTDGSVEINHFNTNFISNWRETHNYKMWLSGVNPGILDVSAGHPFAGQLSVADMKLRLAHTMQNTESGRKINQAMISTGKAVVTTSKVVGGAFSQAKGAVSNWWSNLLVSPELVHKAVEATPEEEDLGDEDCVDQSTCGESPSINENVSNGISKSVDNESVHNLNENGFHQPGEVHTV